MRCSSINYKTPCYLSNIVQLFKTFSWMIYAGCMMDWWVGERWMGCRQHHCGSRSRRPPVWCMLTCVLMHLYGVYVVGGDFPSFAWFSLLWWSHQVIRTPWGVMLWCFHILRFASSEMGQCLSYKPAWQRSKVFETAIWLQLRLQLYPLSLKDWSQYLHHHCYLQQIRAWESVKPGTKNIISLRCIAKLSFILTTIEIKPSIFVSL